MQPYDWTSHACAAANTRQVDECSACGFPARASGNAIFAAKTAQAQGVNVPTAPVTVNKTGDMESIEQLLAPMPFFSKVIAVLAGLTAAAGLILIKATLYFSEMAIGAGMFFGGVIVAGTLSVLHRKDAPVAPPPEQLRNN